VNLPPVVNREPWAGADYCPQKGLMLLGESHYGTPDEAGDPGFTCNLIGRYVAGTWTHRYYTMVGAILTGVPGPLVPRAAFWRQVVFHNYVPRVMSGPGEAPSEDDWRAGVDVLCGVIDKYLPARVIALSYGVYGALKRFYPGFKHAAPMHFPHWNTPQPFWETFTLPRSDDAPVRGTYIRHPSRADCAEWHEVTERFRVTEDECSRTKGPCP
jgi:hypothetical protein